jgi:hypothetical protein
MRCDSCGSECVPTEHTTGYGQTKEGTVLCFPCCGKRDAEALTRGEPVVLYLTQRGGAPHVSNWPGSLTIPTFRVKQGRHNLARTRTDVWFAFAGKRFHGTIYGDFSQVFTARCVKGG